MPLFSHIQKDGFLMMRLISASIQIIGMSATLNNIEDLQQFLNAEVYTNDFRPVTHFLAHQIENSDVLPCVRNLLSYTSYLTRGPHLSRA